MATRIEVANVVAATGTTAAAPAIVPFNFDDGRVDGLEIIIPDGPAGLVGFKVRHSSQVVIPSSGSDYIISNDEIIHWPLEGYPQANKWDCVIYNTGAFSHTIQFRWLITDVINVPGLAPLVQIGT